MEWLALTMVLMSLYKYLSTVKMMIMMMSLELCSTFLFFLLVFFSFLGNGIVTGVYSVFLILVVCESVIILMSMVNIYRKGSMMVKSLLTLKI